MAAVLFHTLHDSPEVWKDGLSKCIPNLDFRIWPNIGNPLDIQFALIWELPPGSLKDMTNLRCICSLGQGVDHVFRDLELPTKAKIMAIIQNLITIVGSAQPFCSKW